MNTNFLSETLQGIDNFGDPGAYKRMLHLEKQGVRLRTRFIWLTIGSVARLEYST
jgi:hypothetical protein